MCAVLLYKHNKFLYLEPKKTPKYSTTTKAFDAFCFPKQGYMYAKDSNMYGLLKKEGFFGIKFYSVKNVW